MYIGLHVKYPLFLSYFNEAEVSRQIFEKYSNIKSNGNPASGSQVVPCEGRTDGRNFMNAPKNRMFTYVKIQFLLSREHSDFPLERPYRSFSITARNVENV